MIHEWFEKENRQTEIETDGLNSKKQIQPIIEEETEYMESKKKIRIEDAKDKGLK